MIALGGEEDMAGGREGGREGGKKDGSVMLHTTSK